MNNFKTAEDYLRNKYGAYRGSFSWRDEEKAFNAGLQSQTSVIAQLEAELAEARKDQARYQTMRKAIVNCDRKVEEILLQNLTDAGGNDEFDAAVDLAIKEQQ